jgi:hypothetical protein
LMSMYLVGEPKLERRALPEVSRIRINLEKKGYRFDVFTKVKDN